MPELDLRTHSFVVDDAVVIPDTEIADVDAKTYLFALAALFLWQLTVLTDLKVLAIVFLYFRESATYPSASLSSHHVFSMFECPHHYVQGLKGSDIWQFYEEFDQIC